MSGRQVSRPLARNSTRLDFLDLNRSTAATCRHESPFPGQGVLDHNCNAALFRVIRAARVRNPGPRVQANVPRLPTTPVPHRFPLHTATIVDGRRQVRSEENVPVAREVMASGPVQSSSVPGPVGSPSRAYSPADPPPARRRAPVHRTALSPDCSYPRLLAPGTRSRTSALECMTVRRTRSAGMREPPADRRHSTAFS